MFFKEWASVAECVSYKLPGNKSAQVLWDQWVRRGVCSNLSAYGAASELRMAVFGRLKSKRRLAAPERKFL
jgi:hypothetical protein